MILLVVIKVNLHTFKNANRLGIEWVTILSMTVTMEFSIVLVHHAGKVQSLAQSLFLYILEVYQKLVVPTGRIVMLKFQLCYYILEL